MFVDYARIHVQAGDGGNGCLAFRREKFVPRGGPSGGDGGKGGDVCIRSSSQLNTLLAFRYKRRFKAQRGSHGSGKNRHGKDGADLTIEVPVGTQMLDSESGELVFDFQDSEQQVVVARGGWGGRGNAAFATSTNQAPRRHEEGRPGEERDFVLELKVLADVGLIGYPNAGKSTLISVISAARPEIADYPFTTLTPNLGVVACGDYQSYVVADIPGLIAGAHQGSGLGDQFLRHVERTELLIHLVDVSDGNDRDPVEALQTIQKELRLYKEDLAEKTQIIVASKLDAANPEKLEKLTSFCRDADIPFHTISAATGSGIKELKDMMASRLGVGRG